MRRQKDLQGEYHHRIFHALHDWDRAWAGALAVAGEDARARSLGFDQLGHFGDRGCALVAGEVAARLAADGPVTLAEFGCGFGGALRAVLRDLREHGVEVAWALGIDLVWDHVRLCRTIGGTEPSGAGPSGAGPSGAAGAAVRPVQADAGAVPLREGVLDAVVCTGSLPHFADPGRVFAEAARTLRPGGVLVMTEETSLLAPGRAVSAEFRRLHPPGIFFLAEVGERVVQLWDAGFTDIRVRSLRSWACEHLRDRLKAMRLFFGDVAAIYGESEAGTLVDTLGAALGEYESGAVVPALVTARRSP
ncbi:class I SAM-dependent methyltransferase [Streptomyces nondiastaticus]|uniref:Class I SAM-dependent methyltransferase n=1 Tax=Streptomyces nondiastaticus TaxID=3154512 RepID=A0ABW6TQU8_9ACTN